jgi:hypothetical protein
VKRIFYWGTLILFLFSGFYYLNTYDRISPEDVPYYTAIDLLVDRETNRTVTLRLPSGYLLDDDFYINGVIKKRPITSAMYSASDIDFDSLNKSPVIHRGPFVTLDLSTLYPEFKPRSLDNINEFIDKKNNVRKIYIGIMTVSRLTPDTDWIDRLYSHKYAYEYKKLLTVVENSKRFVSGGVDVQEFDCGEGCAHKSVSYSGETSAARTSSADVLVKRSVDHTDDYVMGCSKNAVERCRMEIYIESIKSIAYIRFHGSLKNQSKYIADSARSLLENSMMPQANQ